MMAEKSPKNDPLAPIQPFMPGESNSIIKGKSLDIYKATYEALTLGQTKINIPWRWQMIHYSSISIIPLLKLLSKTLSIQFLTENITLRHF
jgi:hypothetical protein